MPRSSQRMQTAPIPTQSKYSTYSTGTSSLISQINKGKQKLKVMELELDQMDSRMESLATKIKTLKTQIENYESSNCQEGVCIE